jgi:hypothetical protein
MLNRIFGTHRDNEKSHWLPSPLVGLQKYIMVYPLIRGFVDRGSWRCDQGKRRYSKTDILTVLLAASITLADIMGSRKGAHIG